MARLKVKDITMNIEIEGAGKETTVFLHGMGDNLKMWWNQLGVITENYRMMLFDSLGHGQTDRPKTGYTISEVSGWAFEQYRVAKVQAAVDFDMPDDVPSMAKPFIWLGYSWGGRIATEVAIAHSEWVKGLILASSNPIPGQPSPEALKRREDMLALLRKNDIKKYAEMATESAFSPNFKQKNPKAYDQYLKVKQSNKPDGVLRAMEGAAASTGKPDLSKIKCPVLIIAGEFDNYMGPKQAGELQAAIPGSKLLVLPTGHASMIEAPDQFNKAVIDFIKSVAT